MWLGVFTCFIFLLFVTAEGWIYVKTDYQFDDIEPRVENCLPHSGIGLCNLRSAWLSCITFATNDTKEKTVSCFIDVLPSAKASVSIPFNQSYGQLVLPDTGTTNVELQLRGNGHMVFSKDVHSSGKLNYPSITRTYQLLQNTNNAQVNAGILSIGQKCAGDVIVITTVGDSSISDSFLRLLNGNNEEIMLNDDYDAFNAAIEYVIPSNGSLCQNYTLKVGCYADTSCNTTVNVFTTSLPSYRFLFAQSGPSSSYYTAITIQNLTFSGFGSAVSPVNGGTIYASGPQLQLLLQGIQFNNSSGEFGGAVFINGLEASMISNSTFSNVMASNGGGLYIDKNTTHSQFRNLHMTDCHANQNGGCIYMNEGSNLITFDSIDIINSLAGSGGAIFINSLNTNVSAGNFIIHNTHASSNGGGIAINSQNKDIIFSGISISSSSSTESGGGVYVNNDNDRLVFTNMSIGNCYSSDGGAMYIETGNQHLFITNSVFAHNSAEISGGCLYIGSSNWFLLINTTMFTHCYAAFFGGSILIGRYNNDLVIQNTEIAYSKAFDADLNFGYGGGVMLFVRNYNLTFEKIHFHHNYATFGACLFSFGANSFWTISKSTFDSSLGDIGTAIYLGGRYRHVVIKENTFTNNVASQYSAGVYIDKNSTFIEFISNKFENLTSSIGGTAIFISQRNSNISITDNEFASIDTTTGSGAVMIYQRNMDLLIRNNSFMNCFANHSAGGLILFSNNRNIDIVGNQFLHTSGSYGGGLALFQDNVDILIDQNSFVDCGPSIMGGGLFIGSSNGNIMISESMITNCTAGIGAGISLFQNNHEIFIQNSAFNNNTARMGAGIAVYQDNFNIKIANCDMQGLISFSFGGGLAVYERNKNVTVDNIKVISSKASSGGGGIAVISQNQEILVMNSKIEQNTASQFGGGVYISDSNEFVTLFNNSLRNNIAGLNGGGVMLNKTNHNVTIAGCQIVENQASQGGGLYVGYTNLQCTITDTISYLYTTYGEYESNMTTPGILFAQNVSAPSAVGYIITFTVGNIGYKDILQIFGDQNKLLVEFDGSSDYPGLEVPSLFLQTQALQIHLVSTTTTMYYAEYGFEYVVTPVLSTRTDTIPTIVQSNAAAHGSGGGLYFYSNNLNIFVLNTIIEDNHAAAVGGGVVFQLVQADVSLMGCDFMNNSAGTNGGGMSILAGNYGFQLFNNVWANNFAINNGGAVNVGTSNGIGIFADDNVLRFSNNSFWGNLAFSNAGVLYADTENDIIVEDSLFQANAAFASGGAICLNSLNKLSMLTSLIMANLASEGGGIASTLSPNLLILNGTVFSFNGAAKCGGGLILDGATQTTFINVNKFLGNYAFMGGGIAALVIDLWQMSSAQLVFEDNLAFMGSALFCYPLFGKQGKNSLQNITFSANKGFGGPTVLWLFDELMTEEPPGLSSSTLTWWNNSALYGERWGTQGVTLHSPATYEVSVYNENFSPSIVLTMSDHYNQSMPISNVTLVKPLVITEQVQQQYRGQYSRSPLPQCQSFVPAISGSDLVGVKFLKGQAIFNNLQGFCSPGGNFSLAFEADLSDLLNKISSPLVNKVFSLSATSILSFRPCVEGEYEKNGACNICSLGTYSLTVSGNVESCSDCTELSGIRECYADQLILEKGFWRRYPYSTAVLTCPLGGASCIGGNLTGHALCSTGYTGPLCSVCAAGYYLSDGECMGCDGSSAISPSLMVMIVLLAIAASCIPLIYMYCQAIRPTHEQSDWELWFLRLKDKHTELTARLKIVIATYQIVITTSSTFVVSMPIAFSKLVNAFNFINLDFAMLFPIGCTANFNFMTQLLWTTLSPIALSLLLFICFWTEYAYLRSWIQANPDRLKGAKSRQFEETKNKYLELFFYLTYLILPSVTTTIFQLFVCENIDPNHEDDDQYDWYLKADMSISCQSSYYKQWLVYGVVMIVVYPIGIPSMYLWCLYQCKDEIMTRNNTPAQSTHLVSNFEVNHVSFDVDQAENKTETQNPLTNNMEAIGQSPRSAPMTTTRPPMVSPKITRIQFLWRAYEPKYWYWEIVETTRRIMLTAVLSVVSPGSSEQSLLGIMLAFIFIKVYTYFRPYLLDRNDVLAEVGQIQILLTFICAMTIRNNLLPDSYATGMDILLILVNFAVMGVILYNSVCSYIEKYPVTQWQFLPWLSVLMMRKNIAQSVNANENSVIPAKSPEKEVEMAVFSTNNNSPMKEVA